MKFIPNLVEIGPDDRESYYITNGASVTDSREKRLSVPSIRVKCTEDGPSEQEIRDQIQFAGDSEEEEIDPRFDKLYADAVFGRLKNWRLLEVEIDNNNGGITFCLANDITGEFQYCFISPTSPLKVMFETENEAGLTVHHLYEIQIEGHATSDNLPKLLKVTIWTEPEKVREIYFRIEGWFEPRLISEPWDRYWLVRESIT